MATAGGFVLNVPLINVQAPGQPRPRAFATARAAGARSARDLEHLLLLWRPQTFWIARIRMARYIVSAGRRAFQ
ncbi:hypothetical protein GCM10009779_25280 [Polymorphospora rubra]